MAFLGAVIGSAADVTAGAAKIMAANVNAQAQKLDIQGKILQTIGTAFGFETQAQQYTYGANIARYQAGVADANKTIALGNAAYARDVGEVDVTQDAAKTRADLGMMKATQGASGLDVGTGTSVDVRESMINVGYYDQSVIRSTAARKAYGYEVEADAAQAQGDVYRYTAAQNEAQATTSLQAADLTRQALPLEYAAMGLADEAKAAAITGAIASTVSSVSDKWIAASKMT